MKLSKKQKKKIKAELRFMLRSSAQRFERALEALKNNKVHGDMAPIHKNEGCFYSWYFDSHEDFDFLIDIEPFRALFAKEVGIYPLTPLEKFLQPLRTTSSSSDDIGLFSYLRCKLLSLCNEVIDKENNS